MTHDAQGIALARDPSDHPAAFKKAFDSGDPVLLEHVYESDAVFVTPDGRQVSGADRRAANAEFQEIGIPIELDVLQVIPFGADEALLIVSWRIRGTDRTGGHVDVAGTATDVVRRGSDGFWRYVLDCPFGIATGSM